MAGKTIFPLHQFLLRCVLSVMFLAPLSYVQAAKPPAITSKSEMLSLEKAVKKALANNRTIQTQYLGLKAAETGYDDAWDKMFLPGVSVDLGTTSNYTVKQLTRSTAGDLGKPGRSRGYPSSFVALNLGTYTLFNFWKDQIAYDMARLGYDREKQRYQEAERNLKFQVIAAYFRVKTEQDKIEAAKRSVDIAQAIVELVKSRLRVKKATEQALASSTNDYLAAQNQYNETIRNVSGNLWALNLMLGDPINTQYMLNSDLKYSLLQIQPEEAMKTYEESSPSLKDAKLGLKSAELNLELNQKNRLPLPTISLSGVTLTYSNGYYGGKTERTTTNSGLPGNIDVSASISLSIPIIGPGGLFNSRDAQRSAIARDISELNYQQIGSNDQVRIFTLITAIKQQEVSITNQRESFKNSVSLLDNLFESLSNQQVSRLELRDAINQARETEFSLKDSILNHLAGKLELAGLIGVDRLPGDSY